MKASAAATAWHLVEDWVAEALRRGKADQSPEAIKQHLERATMQLWLAWGGRRASGCCITELFESARGKVCNLVVVAGVDFDTWLPLTDAIKAWAREKGCVRLEAAGREGWERRLKGEGWRKVRTVIEMEL